MPSSAFTSSLACNIGIKNLFIFIHIYNQINHLNLFELARQKRVLEF